MKKIYRPQTNRRVHIEIFDIVRRNGTRSFKIYTRYGNTWARIKTVIGQLGQVTINKVGRIKGK